MTICDQCDHVAQNEKNVGNVINFAAVPLDGSSILFYECSAFLDMWQDLETVRPYRGKLPKLRKSDCNLGLRTKDLQHFVQVHRLKHACVSALVSLQVRTLCVDLPAVRKEAAVNPFLVLARRTIGRIARRR